MIKKADKAPVCSWCGQEYSAERGVVVHYLRGQHHAGCLLKRLEVEKKSGKRSKGRGE